MRPRPTRRPPPIDYRHCVPSLASRSRWRSACRSARPARPERGAARPRARGRSYLTGIGDESARCSATRCGTQLHTKIVRYIAPYDAVAHSYSLDQAINFIQAAEAQHQQVLVAFYHSEYTPTKLPSVAQPTSATCRSSSSCFPHVRQYQSWDEANRGNVAARVRQPLGGRRRRKYYQALSTRVQGLHRDRARRARCAEHRSDAEYISEFKREIGRLQTVMPKIWGLHNYSDVNRLESWRTRELVRRSAARCG